MRTLLLSIAAPLCLAGCVADNARDQIGNTQVLPELEEPVVSATPPAERRPDLPSLMSLNRANWLRQDLVVEPDGVMHRPRYATYGVTTSTTSRQRGDPPTPGSALEGPGVSRGGQYAEAFKTPLIAIYDLVMLPYRFVKNPEWNSIERGPTRAYWRAPVWTAHGDVWTQGEIIETAPIAADPQPTAKRVESAAGELKP